MLASLGLAVCGLRAQPTGGTVVAGEATIAAAPGLTTVTAGNNSVVRWSSFDVPVNETVRFVQPGADSRVLNWIGGLRPSQIDGTLQANGQVYLVNNSGIFFGQTAVVDAGRLVAVGGAFSKEDFLNGLDRFTDLKGEINNAGSIRGEMVALIGRSVVNTGSIVSPGGFVGLASGDQVLLGQDGSSIYVDAGKSAPTTPAATGTGVTNSGTIDAGHGTAVLAAGDFYSIAITHSGQLKANNVKIQGQGRGDVLVSGNIYTASETPGTTGGRVEVTGERVALVGNASINASGPAGGGTILIGGDYQGKNPDVRNAAHTFVGKDVTLTADATANGNGGKIITWADESTRFFGKLSAQGGPQGGNGGFAEVSGKQNLTFAGTANLSSPHGSAGSLLLDPEDLYVGADPGGGATQDTTDPFQAIGAVYYVLQASLSADASYTLSANHDVFFNANITFGTAGANTVAVTAVNAITSTGFTVATSGGAMTFTAPTINAGALSTGAGNLTLNATTAITTSGNLVSADTLTLSTGTLSMGGNLEGTNAVNVTNSGAFTYTSGNVIGTTFTLSGAGQVGTLVAPVVTDVTNLTLAKASGATYANDIGSLTLSGTTGGLLTLSMPGTLTVGSTTVTGNLSLESGLIDLTAAISGSGSLILKPAVDGSSIGLGTGSTGTYNLDTTELGYLTNGFTSITIGRATGTGTIDISAAGASFTDPVTIQSAGVGGSIISDGPIAGTGDASVTLLAGSGGIFLNATSTVTTAGQNITIVSTDGLEIADAVSAGAGNISITSGTIILTGTLSGSGTLTLQPASDGIGIGLGTGATGAFSLDATELGQLTNGFSAITIGRATGTAAIQIGAGVTFTDPVTIQKPGSGNGITLIATGVLDSSGNALTLNAGDGAFTQASGGTIAVGAGSLTVMADTIALAGAGSITGTGTVVLQPFTASQPIEIGTGAAGSFALTSAEIATLANGFTNIFIGHPTGSGGISVVGTVTFTDPVTLRSPSAGAIDVQAAITGTGDASITLNGGAPTILEAGITTADQNITISDDVEVVEAGTVVLSTDVAGGGNIAISGTVNGTAGGGAESLQVITGSGTTTFSGAVGGVDPLNLTLQSSNAGNTGGITFNAAVNALSLTTFGEAYSVELNADTVVTADTNFLNTGPITLGNGSTDNLNFTGGLDTTATSNTNVGGNLSTTSTAMDLGQVTLLSASTLDSVGGNISIGSIVGGGFNLSLQAGIGAGTTTVTGNVGNLGTGTGAALTINTAVTGLVDFQGTFGGNSGITAGSGTSVRFGNNVTLADGNTGTSLAGNVTLGNLTFSGFDGLSFGALSLGNGLTTINSNGSNVDFTSTVNATNAGTVDASLDVSAGAGTVTFANNVGGTQALADLDVTATSIVLNGATINVNDDDAGAATSTLTGAVTLGTDVTVNTDKAAGTDNSVIFASPVNADLAASNRKLTVTAGTGTSTFASIGSVEALADLDIQSATINLNGTNVNVNAGAGGATATLTGAVVLGNNVSISTNGTADNNITFTSTINADDASTQNRTLTLDAGTATVTLGGQVGNTQPLADFDAIAGSFILSGSLNIDDDDAPAATVTFNGAVKVNANITIDTDKTAAGDSSITFTNTIDSNTATDRSLIVVAGEGDVTVSGAIGNLNDLASLDISGNDITLANIGGALSGVTGTTTITAADGADNALLTLGGSVYKTAGAQSYTGGTDGISLTSSSGVAVTTSDANVSFTGTTTLSNGADLTVTTSGSASGSGDITFNGIRGTSSEDVTLNAGAADLSVGAIGNANEINTIDLTAGKITLNGDIKTSDASGNTVSFTGAVLLGGNVTIDTNNATNDGAISFSSTINSAPATNYDLSLLTGTAAPTFGGALGGVDALGTLTITNTAAGGMALQAVNADVINLSHSGNLTQTAGTLTAVTSINFSGTGAVGASGALINTAAPLITLNKAGGATFVSNTGALNISGTSAANVAIAGTSTINVVDDLNLGANTLRLVADGGISQTAGKIITAGAASFRNGATAGDIILTEANAITTVAAENAFATGDINIKSDVAAGLTIGSVASTGSFAATTGLLTNLGDITATNTTGGIFVTQSVKTSAVPDNGGTLTLSGIIQSVGTVIEADTGTTITLSGAFVDTVINGTLSVANTSITATRDIIINGTLSTTSTTSLTLEADSDDNNTGGVLITSTGSLTANSLTTGLFIIGSNIVNAGNIGGAGLGVGSSFYVAAGGTVTTSHNITVSTQASATAADITLLGNGTNAALTTTGGNITLTPEASGTIVLNGGSLANPLISSSGTQTFADAVTLGGNTRLAGTTVTFQDVIAGGTNGLTVAGDAVFGNATGDTVTGLSTLTVTGATTINTNTITSTGAQTYTGTVAVNNSTTLTAGSASLGAVTGATNADLTVTATGNVTLAAVTLAGTGALSATVDSDNNGTNTLALNGTVTAAGVTLSGGGTGTNDTIDINADVDATTGALVIQNASAVDLAANVDLSGASVAANSNVTAINLSGAGTNLVTGTAGSVNLGAVTDTATANLTVSATTGVTLAAVTLDASGGGALSVTADSDDNSTSTLTANGAITANGVTLSGGGTGTNDTITVNADVTATTGGLSIQNADTVNLAANVDLTGAGIGISNNVGAIALTGGSGTTNILTSTGNSNGIALSPVTGASNPNLTLISDGDLGLGGSINIGTGAFSARVDNNDDAANTLSVTSAPTAGSITLSGGGTGTGDLIDIDVDLTASTGALTIQNAAAVDLAANVDLIGASVAANSNVGTITLSGAGTNLVTGTAGSVNLGAVVDVAMADLTVSATTGVTLAAVTLNDGGALSATADSNNNSSDTLALNGAVTANGITLSGGGAGTGDTIDINADVDATTASLVIQNAATVDLAANVDLSGTNVTASSNVGAINLSGAGTNLVTSVGGSVDLGPVTDSATANLTISSVADVTLAAVTLDAGGGGSLSVTVDSDDDGASSVTLNGAVAANGVTLQGGGTGATDTIDVNADVSATTGALVLQNAAAVDLAANVDLTGASVAANTNVGGINLSGAGTNLVTGTAGSVNLAAVTDSANANLTVSSTTNVTLAAVTLNDGGALSATADSDNNGTNTLALNGAVTATGVTLSGGGTGTNDTIDINADVDATTGALAIQNASVVDLAANVDLSGASVAANSSVTAINLSGAGTNLVTATAGSVNLGAVTDTATANLTVSATTDVTLAAVTLDASGGGALSVTADSDDNSNSTLALNGAVTANGVTLSGGGTGTNDTIDINADVTATTGALTIQNADTVDLAANVDLTGTGVGIDNNVAAITLSGGSGTTNIITSTGDGNSVAYAPITGASNPNLTLRSEGDLAVDSTIDVGTGALSATADTDNDGTNTLTVSGSPVAGTITLSGGGTGTNDTIDIDADVDATAGALTIQNASVVDLGANVDLSGTSVAVNTNVGGITLSGAGTNLVTATAGSVNLAAVSDTAMADLTVSATTGVTLAAVTLNDGGALSATVDSDDNSSDTLALNGAVLATGVTLSGGGTGTGDTIDINADVDSTTVSLLIQNAATVDLAANVDLTGTTVAANTNVGAINLSGAGTNLVTATAGSVNLGAVTDSATANLTISATDSVTLAAVTLDASGGGALSVTADSNDDSTETLTLNGAVAANGVTLSGGATGPDETIDINADVTATTGALVIQNADTVDLAANVDLTGAGAGVSNNITGILLSGAGTNIITSTGGTNAVTLAPVTDSAAANLTVNSQGGVTVSDITLDDGGAGQISISANTDGVGAQGFAQNASTSIVTTNDTATAVSITVNTGGGGTGGAAIRTITAGTTAGAAGGRVTINANGGAITDADASATNNITAGNAVLSGTGGVGTSGNPIETTISNLEASGGTGGVFVANTGALTVGGIGALTGVASTSGDITLSATTTLDVNATVTSTSGSLSLTGGTGVTHTAAGDLSTGSTGTISVTATANDITMVNGTVYGAGSGAITLTAAGNVALGRIGGTGNATVTATAGAITDVTGTEGSGNENVVGNVVTLTAATGIGVTGAAGDIDTAATQLDLTTGTGGIFVTETDGVQLGNGTGGLDTTTSGDIVVVAGGAITTGNTVTTAGNGNIDLSTTSGAITLGNAVTANGSGNVTLNAAGLLTVNALVSSTSGNLALTGGTGVTHSAAGSLTTGTTGTIDVTATANDITMADGTVYSTGSGVVTLAAGTNIALGQVSTTGNVTATATAGAITDITSAEGSGNENVAGNVVTLTAGTGIGATGAAGDIDTAATQLDLTTGTGGIFIAETNGVQLGNGTGGLDTTTSGDIIVVAGGAITTGNTVTTAGNGNIGLSTTAGAITLSNAVTANGSGNVTLNAAGLLTVNALVSSTSGNLTLTGGTGVTHSAAGGLTTGSTGTIGVTATANNITMVDGTVYTAGSGAVTMTAANNIVLGQVTTTGNVTGTATAGAITDITAGEGSGNENVSGNVVTLTAGTGLGVTGAAGDIDTAATQLDLTTGTGGIFVTETDGVQLGNGTGGLNTTTSGDIVVVAGGAITTGNTVTTAGNGNIDLSTTAGGITLGNSVTANGSGNVTLNAAGTLTVNAVVSSTSGNLALTGGTGVTHSAGGSLTTGTTGTIDVTATANDITMADGTAYSTGSGAITLAANGSVGLGQVTTTGNVTATATTGNITDNTAAEGSGNENISGNVVTLTAATGIGAATAAPDIDTAATQLDLTTGTGGIFVTETNGVQLGNGTGGLNTTTSGDIIVVAGGAVTTGNTITTAGNGNIGISTTAGAITLSNAVTANGSGNVTLNAAGLLTVNALVSSTSGNLALTGGTGVTHSAAGSLTTGTAGTIGVTATANDITMADGTVYTTGSGTVTLTAATNVILGQISTTSSAINVTATAGAITDTTAAEAANLTTTGTATLAAATGIGSAGGAADIDTTIGTLVATNSTSGNIVVQETSGLIIGGATSTGGGNGNIDIRTSAGAFDVNSAVTANGSGNVTLVATGGLLTVNALVSSTSGNLSLTGGTGVTHTATGDLTTGSTGTIGVTATTNDITMVDGTVYTAGSGNVTLAAATNIALGQVTTTGNVTATATAGAITDVTSGEGSGNENVSGNVVTLTAATGIGATGAATDIDTAATQLDLTTATGGIFIAETDGVQLGNGTGGLNTTTSGDIVVVAGGAITTGNTVTTAGNGNIGISTTTGGITLNNAVTANGSGNVTLNAVAGLAVNALVSSTSGNLALTAGTSVTHSATGDLTTGTTGTIGVTATANDITMVDGTVYTTGSGAITLSAGGNVDLGQIATTGNVTIGAGGAIADVTSGEGAGNENISGNVVTLTAVAGIGSAGAATDIDTAATQLDLSVTSTGGIFIAETNGVQLGNGTGGLDTTGGNITVVAGGAITTGAAISAAGNVALSTTAGGITLSNALTTTLGSNGTVTVNAAGTTTLTAAGDISADGAVSLTGGTGISTAGDVTTTDDNVTYVSATTLTGAVAVDTGSGGAGNISFNSTLDGAQNLTLTAGTGDITFTGTVGATRLANVVINSAANVTANAFSATNLTQFAGSGTTTFNGAVNTNGSTTGVSLTGTNLQVNAGITTTNTGQVTVAQSGTATFAAAGDITSDGAVSLTATGGITTAGDVTTTSDNVTFASATSLTGPVTIQAVAGNITFSSTVDGTQNLIANSTGITRFNAAVGGITPLASLTTDGGVRTEINGNVTTTGAQNYGDSVRIDATNVTMATTNNQVIFGANIDGVSNYANNLTVTTGTADTTIAGTVGSTTPLASLTINNTSTNGMLLPSTAVGALTVTTNGLITDKSGAIIDVTGLATFNSGAGNIVLGNVGADVVNFGTVSLSGANATILEDSATVFAGTSNLTGVLNLTANGAISNSPGASLTVGGVATLNAGANDITLGGSPNTLSLAYLNDPAHVSTTIVTPDGLPANMNFGSIVFQGNNVSIAEDSHMDVQGVGTGHVALNGAQGVQMDGITAPSLSVVIAGVVAGNITQTSAPVVIQPGLSYFDSNGGNISLNGGANNFAEVLLAGNNVVLGTQQTVNVIGLTATGSTTISSVGLMTISNPLTSPVSLTVQSSGSDVLVYASISSSGALIVEAPLGSVSGTSAGTLTTSGGNVTVTAGQNVGLAGTIATGNGSLTVTADGNVQLADLLTGSGNIAVTATNGLASFTSALSVASTFTVTGGNGITFTQALSGGGNLVANSGVTTSFLGPINGLNSLITNSGGTTRLAGGAVTVGTFTFNDAVVLATGTTTLNANSGIFGGTVNGDVGGRNLILNIPGNVEFRGAVGTGQSLGSITTTLSTGGATRFYGVPVTTSGDQIYNNPVQLGGARVDFTAANLTFNQPITRAVPQNPGAATTLAGLTANVTGAAKFNSTVGTASETIGDVVIGNANLPLASRGTTLIRADFNAYSLTINNPVEFNALSSLATINTTDFQAYNSSVLLGTDMNFVSTASSLAGATRDTGILFAQGMTGGGRTVSLIARSGTIVTEGSVGLLGNADADRLKAISAEGRYVVVGDDIYTTGDIKLSAGTAGTNALNDFIQFNNIGDRTTARSTRIDSLTGEVVLGSGAAGGTTAAKTETQVPLQASIFKSNPGDLYIFGRKITIQPNERMAVRNGSLVMIADGATAADGGITLSSTAASQYLILVSSVPASASNPTAFRIRARAPAQFLGANGATTTDRGTDLVAGHVLFYGVVTGKDMPTRSKFIPNDGSTGPATQVFNYTSEANRNGSLVLIPANQFISVIPGAGTTVRTVNIADLQTTNSSRTFISNVQYLNLGPANGNITDVFIPASLFGDIPGLGLPQRVLAANDANSSDRNPVSGINTPNVPREEIAAAPTENDFSPAVREQLQALGIYARALFPEEVESRRRQSGVFTSIPYRLRPVESDYLVVDARVEDKAVRDVIANALETGLIGAGQAKLEAVASALSTTYEAYTKAHEAGDKSPEVLVAEYREWLLANNTGTEAKVVLDYLKALRATLTKIELLGLTHQELEGSKAQIYGSVLRARLNVEPEFLRALVEGAPESIWSVNAPPPVKSKEHAAIVPVETKAGRAMY